MKLKPGTFDAYKLAREQGVLEGTLEVADHERLDDRVAEGETQVAWRITGAKDIAGRPALDISITGEVLVTCQRCLTDFLLPVSRQTTALLAKSESDADALDATSDDEVLVADQPLDAVALVEDELLLTLPFAPMHEPGQCPAVETT